MVSVAKERVLLFRHILRLYLYVAPLFLKLLVWLLSFQTLLCSQATASSWRMYNYVSHFEHASFKAPQTIKMRRNPLKPHTITRRFPKCHRIWEFLQKFSPQEQRIFGGTLRKISAFASTTSESPVTDKTLLPSEEFSDNSLCEFSDKSYDMTVKASANPVFHRRRHS